MESISVVLLKSLLWPSIAVVAVSISSLITWEVYSRKLLIRKLRKVMENPETAEAVIKNRYSPEYILFRSGVFESFARKNGPEILVLTGMDELWIERLSRKRKRRDFNRVMKYSQEKGLFKCFLAALRNNTLAVLLIRYLEESGDLLYMRRLALSGKGEEFDGAGALRIFAARLGLIREMTGDPEWASRYFAVKILLHDSDEKSVRALWDGFRDSHPLVRKTVALEFKASDEKRHFEELYALVLNDPVYEVRKAAHGRIMAEFSGQYHPDPGELRDSQMWHVLGLLRDGSKDDENFAMRYLDNDDLELRQIAARYLDRNGALERLCAGVDLGDRDDFGRKLALLMKACEVNVTSFLSIVKSTGNSASLLALAMILSGAGDRTLITELAGKVFAVPGGNETAMELYKATLTCVSLRGDENALAQMEREMNRRKAEPDIMNAHLSLVPERGGELFVSTLISFLKDAAFEPKGPLREALRKMPLSRVLDETFEILKEGREAYPHAVRIEALKLLGEINKPYCIQMILENLPMLPVEQGKEFAQVLAGYPRPVLLKKLSDLLGSVDAKIRASIITVLPVTRESSFLKEILKSMKDADPDVRVASVWALVEFDDLKSLGDALSMLRDPVERVRSEVGRVLGMYGSDKIIKELRDVLFDENEVAPVRTAVIRGLAASPAIGSIDILMERLETEEELADEITKALSVKTGKKEITRMIETFKDALPNFRERIRKVFIAMGESGEKRFEELLREDIPSLNPHVVRILEDTGYVESNIRKLSHRDPSERRASAGFLSLVGTTSAFRGIVLAARDPDEEVRVMVVKALEKLEKKDGREILDSLENDPDRRVRKYTHWALERLRAKAL